MAPLRADLVYDVGNNTTFAHFSDAFTQALADQSGPFAVTARVRVLTDVSDALDLDYGVLALQPQPGAGLVIESGPGIQATISGSGAYGIRISGVAHVTLQSLKVQGFSVDSLKLANAANAVIRANVFTGAGSGAVDAQDCSNLQLLDNTLAPSAGTAALVDRCGGATLQGNQVPSSSAPSYGLVLQNSASSWMTGNRADNADYAFNLYSSASVTVTGNVAIGRGKQRGLVLDNSNGFRILRNLLVGQVVGVELQSSPSGVVYQNTVWDHVTAGLYVGTGSTSVTLRNNLWQGFFAYYLNSAAQSSLSSDHNGFNDTGQMGVGSGSYTALTDWQATGQDATAIQADPLFVDATGSQPEKFKLQPGSPVKGYGVDLSAEYNTDYFGNPLSPAPAIWDPGIHVASVLQNTPTSTPTPTPVQPTPTPSSTATPTVSPTFTPSPIGTATLTFSATRTFTITPTYTATPYPYRHDRVLSYPNPWSPASGSPVNIVFDPDNNAGIRIIDMAGELVIELPSNELQPDLGHAVWDGRDRNGSLVPSGLYMCIVNTSKGTRFTRMTVLY